MLINFYMGEVEWKWHSAVKTDLFFLEVDKFESKARLLTLLNHLNISVFEIPEYKLNSLVLAMISYKTEWNWLLKLAQWKFSLLIREEVFVDKTWGQVWN